MMTEQDFWDEVFLSEYSLAPMESESAAESAATKADKALELRRERGLPSSGSDTLAQQVPLMLILQAIERMRGLEDSEH